MVRPKPGLVERRFRADVKYWLMDAKYYERGELSVGNWWTWYGS